jgi:hypothetical protein
MRLVDLDPDEVDQGVPSGQCHDREGQGAAGGDSEGELAPVTPTDQHGEQQDRGGLDCC